MVDTNKIKENVITLCNASEQMDVLLNRLGVKIEDRGQNATQQDIINLKRCQGNMQRIIIQIRDMLR